MKVNKFLRINLKKTDVNPFVWVLFVLYIVFSNVVTQIFNIESSRLSGIILISPVLLMLIVTLINNRGHLIICLNYYHIYILIFGIFCLASSLWAENSALAISKGVDIIEIFIIMVIVAICFRKVNSVESYLKAIMWSYYIVILYEIAFWGWDYFLLVIHNSTRVTSEFLNSNTLGMCASFAIIINLSFFISKKVPAWTLLFAVIGIVVIAASGSRKALIALLFGIFLFLLIRSLRSGRRSHPFIRLLIVLPIIIFIVYQILQLPMFSGIMERIKGMTNLVTGGTLDKSSRIRISLVQLGVSLFKKHPFLGIGIDNPRLYTYDVVGETFYLHNNYVELLSSGGIFGIMLYYWMYVKLLISYLKRRNFNDPLYCTCLVLFVLLLILDYGMVSYYSKSTYIFLYLFVMFESKLRHEQTGGKNNAVTINN